MGGINVSAVVVFDRSLEVIGLMERRMEEEADHSAQRIAERAADNSPKRTGTLAGDYEVTGSGTDRQVGNDAPYFKFVEFGTRKMAAEPSLGPAAREEEGPFNTGVAKAMEEVTAL